ncbi:MAG: HNH endonuclease [Pseudomonadota bacterium]
MPTSDDFQKELDKLLREADELGFQAVEVNAGSLHRRVGGYPSQNHRMPLCCDAMRKRISDGDYELPNDLKKDGASFAVRYALPR